MEEPEVWGMTFFIAIAFIAYCLLIFTAKVIVDNRAANAQVEMVQLYKSRKCEQ